MELESVKDPEIQNEEPETDGQPPIPKIDKAKLMKEFLDIEKKRYNKIKRMIPHFDIMMKD